MQTIDGVTLNLQEAHDFTWLCEYGRVFVAFDQQDSGNICFGVDDGARRLFVKYAGARPVHYAGEPEEAIARLRKAAPLYELLAHPGLVHLLEHRECGAGYACIFAWSEGECLHAHWNFDHHPKYKHPASPNHRFSRLPLARKLSCLDTVVRFHLHVARLGYLAIDFYDGSLMYDFATGRTTICDIDFYRASPSVNRMGRLWGSSRFMSPEAFERGAVLDEVTNVYTMGATAFELLGSNRDRSLAGWRAPESLFYIAKRAVSPERSKRHPSLTCFHDEWQGALAQLGLSAQSSALR